MDSYHGRGVHGKLHRVTSQIKLLTISEATLGYWALNFVVSAAEGAKALHELGEHHATVCIPSPERNCSERE